MHANGAILTGNTEIAIARIIALAELIFPISPFLPDPLPDNWRDILRAWLLGVPLAQLSAANDDVLRFVENGLIYVLPWGMEAVRVRAAASNDVIPGAIPATIDDFETGLAVPAVETGTLNRSAALLMQSGFNSRTAAIKVIAETQATFQTGLELREWLNSEMVRAWTAVAGWPTMETASIWRDFVASFQPRERAIWLDWTYKDSVQWQNPFLSRRLGPPSGSIQAGARPLFLGRISNCGAG